MIRSLDRSSRWTALARGAMRDDFYQAMLSLTDAVLRHTGGVSEDVDDMIPADGAAAPTAVGAGSRRGWRPTGVLWRRCWTLVSELRELDTVDQAPVSVVLRQLRGVVRSADWASETA